MVGQNTWMGNVYYADDPKSTGNIGTFRLEGAEDLMLKLDTAIGIMPDAVLDRLFMHAEKILSDSKLEVPWETTHLMQTGTVEPFQDGTLNGFEIGYNAINTGTVPGFFSGKWAQGQKGEEYNYGLRQHEDTTLYHPKPGRKAKFLEDPFNRHKDKIIPDIVSYIDNAFTQGIPSMSGMMKSSRISLGNLGGRFI